jgi:hypothetical protein
MRFVRQFRRIHERPEEARHWILPRDLPAFLPAPRRLMNSQGATMSRAKTRIQPWPAPP